VPKTEVHVKVSELPAFRRLFLAVHEYLVARLVEEAEQSYARTHTAYCELINAHDALAETP
jgi:hypothetical protein